MGNFLVQIVGQTGVRHGVRSLGTLLIHIFVAVVLSDAAVAQGIPPLLRFPHCSRDRIVFVAEGDLWIVPRSGGTAKRLTHDVGQVFMPHFSPDGAEIAFTVRRGGLNDVWSIPASGGGARRLTHGPSSGAYDNMVTGWTPDGSAVLFLSSRYSAFPKRDVAAFAVPAMGGLARKLPMETSGLLSEAQDGQAFAFDRTFRTFGGDRWKRYVGGQAPQIFVYDTRSGRQRQVTHWIGTNTAPMWWRDRLYFLSDRGRSRRLDLWVTDAEGQNARQVTHTRALDIDVPALGADAITFGLGGRIWQLDLPAEQLHEVPVAVAPSGRLQKRSVAAAPSVRVSDIAGAPDQSLSPDGATATFAARGHLFIRKGDGTTRDLHAGSATDDDHPSISPDGRTVAFISDGDGDERQVAAMPLAGGPVRWLTRVAGSVFGTPVWSPDGSMLAVPDEEHGLWLVASDGSSARRVAMDPIAAIRDGTFSRDGRRLAYSTTRPSGASMLHLLDLGTARDTVLTPPLESDHAPAFSADGRTLFFLSARHDRPVLADRDQGPDIVTAESDGLYRVAIPLAPAMPAPALTRGASPVPSAPGVLSKPEVRGDVLFYRTNEAALVSGTLPGPPPSIHALELGSGRDRVVADGDGSVVSGDGKTVLLRRAGAWHTVDTATGRDTRLDLSALRVTIDPKLEWQKGIDEAWHLDRDLFWDRTMGG